MNLLCTQCDAHITSLLGATWGEEVTASATHLGPSQLGPKKVSQDWSHWLVTVWGVAPEMIPPGDTILLCHTL